MINNSAVHLPIVLKLCGVI